MHVHGNHFNLGLPLETGAAAANAAFAREAARRRKLLTGGTDEKTEWFTVNRPADEQAEQERPSRKQAGASLSTDIEDGEAVPTWSWA